MVGRLMKISALKKSRELTSFSLVLMSLVLVVFSWTFYTPPFASVDEPAHAAAAYVAVHGEIIPPSNRNEITGYITPVNVPNWIFPHVATDGPYCFWGKRDVTANCASHNWNDNSIQLQQNQFVQYFPTFSVLAGIPSIFVSGELAYYLMRLSGGVVFLFMCAVYLLSCLRRDKPKQMLGIFIILTPMTLYGAGTLAPLSLETISSASFLSLMLNRLDYEKGVPRKRWGDTLLILITLFILITVRPSGIFWLIITSVFVVALKKHNIKRFIKEDFKLIMGGTLLVITNLIFIYFHRPDTGYNPLVGEFALTRFLSNQFQSISEYFNNAVGIFGMDVYLPLIFYYVFAGMFFTLVVMSLTSKEVTKWIQFVLLTTISLFVFIPIIANFMYRNIWIYFFQGRYLTPLIAVLITVLILIIKNDTVIFVFSVFSILTTFVGSIFAYLRYSSGITSPCCGVYIRAEANEIWRFGNLDLSWLLIIGLCYFFTFILAGYLLLNSSGKESTKLVSSDYR